MSSPSVKVSPIQKWLICEYRSATYRYSIKFAAPSRKDADDMMKMFYGNDAMRYIKSTQGFKLMTISDTIWLNTLATLGNSLRIPNISVQDAIVRTQKFASDPYMSGLLMWIGLQTRQEGRSLGWFHECFLRSPVSSRLIHECLFQNHDVHSLQRVCEVLVVAIGFKLRMIKAFQPLILSTVLGVGLATFGPLNIRLFLLPMLAKSFPRQAREHIYDSQYGDILRLSDSINSVPGGAMMVNIAVGLISVAVIYGIWRIFLSKNFYNFPIIKQVAAPFHSLMVMANYIGAITSCRTERIACSVLKSVFGERTWKGFAFGEVEASLANNSPFENAFRSKFAMLGNNILVITPTLNSVREKVQSKDTKGIIMELEATGSSLVGNVEVKVQSLKYLILGAAILWFLTNFLIVYKILSVATH